MFSSKNTDWVVIKHAHVFPTYKSLKNGHIKQPHSRVYPFSKYKTNAMVSEQSA